MHGTEKYFNNPHSGVNRLLPFLMSLLLLASCAKKITTKVTPASPVVVQEVDFNTLQGRAQLRYQQGERAAKNVNANLRVKKDSTIWMSFSVFGIIGGFALINKDSITILNSLNKSYTTWDYKTLSRRFNLNIDYPLIQALLLGNLTHPPTPNAQQKTMAERVLLQQQRGDLTITNRIGIPQNKIEQTQLHNAQSESSLTLHYSDFQSIEDQSFPKEVLLHLLYNRNGQTKTYTIAFKYNTIQINNAKLKFPFRIPKKYDRR